MKALVSALALLSFVGAATVPAVAFAQDAASKPAKKKTTAKKHTAKKKTAKKATQS
jgi:topoisomerase IA-like protein